MSHNPDYILGQSVTAARRLAIQDEHFAAPSEQLLDDLTLRPTDRVVELGCGPGGFTRRILPRLGAGGVVVGVDSSKGLLDQAAASLAGGVARFEPVLADVTGLGSWLDGANVVVARAMLHHVPMAEFVLGRLRARLPAGTRVGFIEPDFRAPLARIAYLEATGHSELAPLATWAMALNRLYLSRQISPDVGASMAAALQTAGYRNVQSRWRDFPSDGVVIENMILVYDEIREVIDRLGILSAEAVYAEQQKLRSLPPGPRPAVWGVHSVTAVT